MFVSLGVIVLFALLLLIVAGIIVAASSKGLLAEIVLTVAVLLSLALAWAGLRPLFGPSDVNGLRSLIISLSGVAAVVTSGIVYENILRAKEPKERG